MDSQDKHRFVQRYVERQKAYVPTYTKEDLWSERQRTPSKSLRGNEFGFDTPVLRPRVPVSKNPQTQHAQKTGASKLPRREAKSGVPQDPSPGNKSSDEPRPKRKKASTPTNSDDGRAARLADRRERKKRKRAIVNPPQKHDEDGAPSAVPQKGRKYHKAKKPAALALLYGFSATNVTKDRLTLRSAPTLGVFNKGKASAKKKVTATQKASSKNEVFSESAFLSKRSEQAADPSDVDDDSSIASVSNDSMPQTTQVANHTSKGRDKAIKITTRAASGSEVWDIELQSKLPSSVCEVPSEPRANDSAPVVLDLRGAEWSASLQEHEARGNKALARSLSDSQGPQLARSDLCGVPHAVDEAPSIHPSHSASQVGHRNAGTISRYFAESQPILVPQSSTGSPKKPRSNDSLGVFDVRSPDQAIRGPGLDTQTILQVTSPINSSVSLGQPMVDFCTRFDVVPLKFPSDDSPVPDQDVQDATMGGQMVYQEASPISIGQPLAEFRTGRGMTPLEFLSECSLYDECRAPTNVCLERTVDYGHPEASVTGSQGAEYRQRNEWDPCWPQWCSSGGLVDDDVEDGFLQGYDPSGPECEDPASVEVAECDPEGAQRYDEDESVCWDEESAGGVAGFLEGRALLLGMPEWPRVGLSGLAQAEIDVASRLRGHWRPQR